MLKRLSRWRLAPGTVLGAVALFVSLAGAGYSATGGTFILGKANTAGNPTALSSNTSTGPTMRLTNTGNRPAARFTVNAIAPPFTVNRANKVPDLNADLLDGESAAELKGARASARTFGTCSGVPAICEVFNTKGIDYIVRVATGRYCVGVRGVDAGGGSTQNMALVVPTSRREEAIWALNSSCVSSEFEVVTANIAADGSDGGLANNGFIIVVP